MNCNFSRMLPREYQGKFLLLYLVKKTKLKKKMILKLLFTLTEKTSNYFQYFNTLKIILGI